MQGKGNRKDKLGGGEGCSQVITQMGGWEKFSDCTRRKAKAD